MDVWSCPLGNRAKTRTPGFFSAVVGAQSSISAGTGLLALCVDRYSSPRVHPKFACSTAGFLEARYWFARKRRDFSSQGLQVTLAFAIFTRGVRFNLAARRRATLQDCRRGEESRGWARAIR